MYFKKLLLIIFSLALIQSVQAQNKDDEEENLFNNVNLHSINGFGGIITELYPLDGSLAANSGLMGGILFNQKIFIGGYGMGQATLYKLKKPFELDTVLKYQRLEHGGFMFGYNHNPHKLFHITASSRMGWGYIGAYDKEEPEEIKHKDKVFVVTPNIGVELNVTRWFKINGLVGYRFLTGVDLENYNEKDYNTITTTISLLFGGFNNL